MPDQNASGHPHFLVFAHDRASLQRPVDVLDVDDDSFQSGNIEILETRGVFRKSQFELVPARKHRDSLTVGAGVALPVLQKPVFPARDRHFKHVGGRRLIETLGVKSLSAGQ
jgi:hypothetical protein